MTVQTFQPTAIVDLPAMPAEMAAIVQWANTASAAQSLVELIVDTPFMPQAFWPKFDPRNDQERANARHVAVASGTAAVLYGGPLGLNPLQSLANIHVVKGKPGLPAELMVALVRAAGHEVHVEDSTDTRVRVWGRRRGEDAVYRAEFTIDRAKKAGYVGQNAKYGTDPQAMLYARAASILCRQMAPETLKGLTTLEELADEVEPGAPAPRGTRTVQRAAVPQILEQAAAVTAPAREFIQSASEVGRRAAQPVAPSGPPLPGEDDEPPRQQERQLEPVTDGQLRALGAMFSDLGVKGAGERADRLAVTADIVGRPISSAKDLTRDEASTVLDTLKANGPDVLAKVLGRGPAKDQPATVDEPTAGDALAVPGDDEVVVEDPPGGEDYDPTTDDSWGQQR